MAIYLGETRAVTNRVTAAIERFLGWWLIGPRQHDADLLLSLGRLPRFSAGETNREGVQR